MPSITRTLWTVFLIGSNYANVISDILTLRGMYADQYYWYFGLMVLFLSLGVLGCSLIFSDVRKTNILINIILCALQLDYVYFLIKDLQADPKEDSSKKNRSRKIVQLVAHVFPALLITVHSIFVVDNIRLIPQLSMLFSIIDGSFGFILISCDREISWENIKMILGETFLKSIEMIGFLVLWGIFSRLTHPWGAWVFVLTSIMIACILVRFIDEQRMDGVIIGGFALPFVGGRIRQDSDSSPCGFILRMINFVELGICFFIWREELGSLFSQDIWLDYFIGGWACAILWIIVNIFLYCMSYSQRANKTDTSESVLDTTDKTVL